MPQFSLGVVSLDRKLPMADGQRRAASGSGSGISKSQVTENQEAFLRSTTRRARVEHEARLGACRCLPEVKYKIARLTALVGFHSFCALRADLHLKLQLKSGTLSFSGFGNSRMPPLPDLDPCTLNSVPAFGPCISDSGVSPLPAFGS